jgi:hypothetical protein
MLGMMVGETYPLSKGLTMAKEVEVTGGTVAKPRNYTIPPFQIGSAEPPKISRTGRPSPYAPPEHVPAMHDALVSARAAKDDAENPQDSAWVSFLSDGLTSEQRARNALTQIRKAVSAHAQLDVKAFGGRVWEVVEEVGGEPVSKWYFALQLRPTA